MIDSLALRFFFVSELSTVVSAPNNQPGLWWKMLIQTYKQLASFVPKMEKTDILHTVPRFEEEELAKIIIDNIYIENAKNGLRLLLRRILKFLGNSSCHTDSDHFYR